MEKELLKVKIKVDTEIIQRARDSKKLLVMRTLASEILVVEKKLGKELTDGEVINVVKSSINYRKESLDFAIKAKDNDKIETLMEALELLSVYMPEQLAEEDVRLIIAGILKENSLTGKRDMGKAMKLVNVGLNGKFDGKKISAIVSELLG